ncbi:hypothetical protein NG796_05945 [Laspinema sp. A4]|uniref:hypothetical protein n=1 Tax=Laspinema sp. D2d TaxID=2953686 RepID=UPI0021BB871C|nr:hypothetical protein [Laspinema sp. D2d]MCT7982832.1 hypothetical protein [Laspinema sp. D2d]
MSHYKDYRRYGFRLLTLTAIFLAMIAGFNGFFDPYEVLGTPTIKRLNQVKREKDIQVRLFKTVAVNKIEAKSLFLGSSRTEFGLDTHHPALRHQQPGYNLAITGGNMYEVRRYFDHAIATQPEVKEIVLGLDFFMFNQIRQNTPDFKEHRLETRELFGGDVFEILLSKQALISSLKTFKNSFLRPNNPGFFYADGRRHPDSTIEQVYFNQGVIPRFRMVLRDFLVRPDLYGIYELSPDYLEDLQAIITTSQQRGIRLHLFISPSHAMQWEAIRVAGLWSEFENWKRAIVNLSPIWDFSGYNSMTTEAIANPMQYYIESSHYRKELGDLVLNRILDYQPETVPSDFGLLLTLTNLETHLEQIRRDREVWAKENPKWVEFVEALKP